MWTVLNRGWGSKWCRMFALAVAAGVAGVTAAPALADERRSDGFEPDARREERRDNDRRDGDRHDYDRRDHYRRDDRKDDGVRVDVDLRTGRTRMMERRWHGPRYEERRVKVWCPPEYRTVTDNVWVEPEFKVVQDRVWRNAVTKTEIQKIWVPDKYGRRWVTETGPDGKPVRKIVRVVVKPGYYREKPIEVVVKPGCWETVERHDLVCDGYWKTIERQELVRAGHWDWRTERVKIADGGFHEEPVMGIGIKLD